MKIRDLELCIFKNINALKKVIKENYILRDDCPDIEIIKNKGFDDELCFFAGDYCYSVYIMRCRSGRVIVVETSRQFD